MQAFASSATLRPMTTRALVTRAMQEMVAIPMDEGTSPTVPLDITGDLDTVIKRPMKRCPECAELYSVDTMFCPFCGVKLEHASWTAPTDPAGDPLLTTTIDGRYVVRCVLGEGGTGTVYEVMHQTLNRLFAMKVLRADVANDGTLSARFMQEARATASLKHPHIVSITDFGHTPKGTPYFVMELLQGHTLAHVCKTIGQLPAARAVGIVRQVADALGAAHDAGIVHRDLKPENLFLVGNAEGPAPDSETTEVKTPRDDVRVVDFGAAKIAGAGRMTKTGIVFGTPHYMSPEQASGQPVDHRADIYALGVIMYEIFTGHLPFEADTFMGVLTQHMFVEPPRFAQELAKGGQFQPLFAALEEVTLRAMAKRPELRFQSMQALLDEMDRTLVIEDDGRVSLMEGWRPAPPRRANPISLTTRSADERTRTTSHTSVDMSVVPRAFWPRGALVFFGVATAVFAVGWLIVGPRPSPPKAVATAGPPAGATPEVVLTSPIPAPPPPAALTHLTTSPAFAEIWQADHRIGTAPMDVSLAPGAPPLQYTVRAPGYADRIVVVDQGAGPMLAVELKKNPVTAVAPPPHPRPPAHPPQSGKQSGELIDPFEAH
jgi:serine/threonine protein kinase